MTNLNFLTDWASLWPDSKPVVTGKFRQDPDDFFVDEVLGFSLSGEGEHAYIQIEKTGQNTLWVIEELVSQLGVKPELIGRSGLKDRHAVTRQWLSIQDPKSLLDFDAVNIAGLDVLQAQRHNKKLRPGAHEKNYFRLKLVDVEAEQSDLENRLKDISDQGFPNYFGDQRFGIDNQNLARGWALLSRRRLKTHKKKGVYLSALRAFLFNTVLSQRVKDSLTLPDDEMDTTGPLWGRGRQSVSHKQSDYERKVLVPWQPLCDALEFSGLNQDRRALFVVPEKLRWAWIDSGVLRLEFSLPAGSYATSLLRELGHIQDASRKACQKA